LLSSCKHDIPTYIIPVKACDTVSPSYNKDIQPILKANCYLCHSDSVTEYGNLGTDLETFSSLKQYLVHDYRGDGIYGSNFVHCIEHAQYIVDMPPDYKLDTCSLGQIRNGVKDGANNN
jgi:hypothetical protein